jgi:hypothetical protein
VRKNETIICKDGFSMSVQANETAYCSPRVDGAEKYISVEVGYPSQTEPLLMEWIDGDHNHPTNTVYGYVPADRITLVCIKHGGVVSGELPAGIPYLKPVA